MSALPANVGTGIIRISIMPVSLSDTDTTETTWGRGKVIFTASPQYLTHTVNGLIIPTGPVVAYLYDGAATITLMATDDTDIKPSGWTYRVSFELEGVDITPFNITVPTGSNRALSDIAPVAAT